MVDWRAQDCSDDAPDGTCWYCAAGHREPHHPWCRTQLPPSADLPACRDEDPAWSTSLAACYPDPPEHEGCVSCGAEIDHHLGCPDDPNPDYEAEAELRDGV